MKKIVYYLLLIIPFIDLITSYCERTFTSFISVGTIVKMGLVMFSFIYVFFITKSKYKKKSIIYYSSLLLYIILYFIAKPDLVGYFTELKFIFKIMFFPIILVCLCNYIEDYKINYIEIEKLLKFNVVFMSLTIIIAFLTNTDFPAYVRENIGSVGWYYAANEVGVILTMLFPFVFKKVLNRNYKTIIASLIIIVAMLLIGTKVSFLGTLLPSVLLLIYVLFKEKNKKNLLKNSLVLTLFIIFVLFLYPYSSLSKVIDYYKNSSFGSGDLLSSRGVLLSNTTRTYMDSDLTDKLMGIGWTNRNSIKDNDISVAIEMDFHDIFYRYGIIGSLIYFIPIIFILILMVRYLIIHIKNYNLDIATIIYSSGIAAFVAIIAGHTFTAPFVSLYLAIIMVMFIKMMKDNKISFK